MPAPKRAATKKGGTPIIGMRIPGEKLAEIDRRAKRHRLNRTEYMIRAALGEPLDQATLERRVTELEQRVDGLER